MKIYFIEYKLNSLIKLSVCLRLDVILSDTGSLVFRARANYSYNRILRQCKAECLTSTQFLVELAASIVHGPDYSG
jgi:hypothetical protein